MKKIFIVFAVLFLFQSELFAEESQSKSGVISTVYSQLTQTSAQLTGKMDGSIFSAMQTIFFNSLAFSLIGLILVFWLFKHLKGGGFSRDDLFKGGTWLITVACIYGIMSSYSAYAEFKSWFLIPQHILKAVIGSFAGTSNAGAMLDNLVVKVIVVWEKAYDYGLEDIAMEQGVISKLFGGGEDGWRTNIIVFLGLLIWFLTIGGYTIIAVIIFIMQIMSNFALSIFGCFAPMVIILLLIPQTRGYFFSWLKNYIAISFYIPMTMLPLMLLDKGMGLMNLNEKTLWENTFSQFAFSLVLGGIAFYILTKIPEWINIILGTQESGSGFLAGTAQSMVGGTWKAGQTAYTGAKHTMNGTKKLAGATAKGLAAGASGGIGAVAGAARFGVGMFKGAGEGASGARKAGANMANAIRNGFKATSTFFSR